MNLLFKTNSKIPFAIISSKHKVGDIIFIFGDKYYINCEPKMINQKGEIFKHYYCVKCK